MKNKLQIASLVVLVGMLAFISTGQKAQAIGGQSELFGGSEGMYQLTVTSTGTKVWDGSGVLYRIDLTSGISGATLDYLMAYDTWQSVGMLPSISVATACKITAPIIFQASITVSGQANYKDWSPYGIRFSSGLYIFKSAADSGEANRATIYWRK